MTGLSTGLGRICTLGTLALGAALTAEATTAVAAGSGAPDLDHYCRAQHGSEATAVFRAADGSWICRVPAGLARREHRIDFAAACRLTFGKGGYRQAGAGAHCLGTDGTTDAGYPSRRDIGRRHSDRGGDETVRQVIPNLSGYCRRTYGRGARVAFDRASGLYVCAAARTRHGGIAYRRIDMAAACFYTVRTTNYRFDGARREIRCLVSV